MNTSSNLGLNKGLYISSLDLFENKNMNRGESIRYYQRMLMELTNKKEEDHTFHGKRFIPKDTTDLIKKIFVSDKYVEMMGEKFTEDQLTELNNLLCLVEYDHLKESMTLMECYAEMLELYFSDIKISYEYSNYCGGSSDITTAKVLKTDTFKEYVEKKFKYLNSTQVEQILYTVYDSIRYMLDRVGDIWVDPTDDDWNEELIEYMADRVTEYMKDETEGFFVQ